MKALVPSEILEKKILLIRGEKVMLSMHLADLYNVETRVLNQAVKRNIKRFSEDSIFRLNKTEAEQLISQELIPNKRYVGTSRPYAFTEQGVTMLSSILSSERALQADIAIMWAYAKLRETLKTHKELARNLKHLEAKIEKHDENIKLIFDAIKQLTVSAKPKKKKTPARKKPAS